MTDIPDLKEDDFQLTEDDYGREYYILSIDLGFKEKILQDQAKAKKLVDLQDVVKQLQWANDDLTRRMNKRYQENQDLKKQLGFTDEDCKA